MDSLRGGVIKHRPRNRVPAMCLWIPRCGGRTSLPWPGRASRRPCEEWASSHRDFPTILPCRQRLGDRRGRAGVEYIVLAQPAATSDIDTIAVIGQVAGAVRIRVDHQLHAERLGPLAVN